MMNMMQILGLATNDVTIEISVRKRCRSMRGNERWKFSV